jgi:hypothetical protein
MQEFLPRAAALVLIAPPAADLDVGEHVAVGSYFASFSLPNCDKNNS